MEHPLEKRTKVAVFGPFGYINFGNESTLQAILYHLRLVQPDVEVTCICAGPEAVAATHQVEAIPVSDTFLKSWAPQSALMRMVRRICIGIPNEPYSWFRGVMRLRGTDMLIIPGTGLLTDAYGLLGWGPYNMAKWALIAKICRSKLLFVSVGAGPIYGALGRRFVKSALSLADFRSYRDDSTKLYLESIGFHANNDRIYPDLAFSLPEAGIPHHGAKNGQRPIVGLGLMADPGKLNAPGPSTETYQAYLESLVSVAGWVIARGYDVRLLIGDLGDIGATREFKNLLGERLGARAKRHIIDEPVYSVDDLLSQIAATDIVVATRFHNVLFALLCTKPVIAISFHHKCESLMSMMGLSEYCLDINELKAERLIERFRNLEQNADTLKPVVVEKAREFRQALDEQYRWIFNGMLTSARDGADAEGLLTQRRMPVCPSE